MFYLSILAGFLICLSALINLASGGGLIGAFLFSTGLLTILHFKLNLFTGKAGLFFDNKITDIELIKIWIGNFIGCAFCACLMAMSGWDQPIIERVAAIADIRMNNLFFENFALGIGCGILMFIGVTAHKNMPYLTIMCVIAFILAGFNHCVADMAYFCIYMNCMPFDITNIWLLLDSLFMTTFGNVIGCNLIPFFLYQSQKQSASSSSEI